MVRYSQGKRDKITSYLKNWIEGQTVFKSRTEMAKYLQISSSHLNGVIAGRKRASDTLLRKIEVMTEFDRASSGEPLPISRDVRPYLDLAQELRKWFSSQTRWKTQKELAEHLGISYDMIKKYFVGTRFPTQKNRAKLYGTTGIRLLEEDRDAAGKQRVAKLSMEGGYSVEGHFEKIAEGARIIQQGVESLERHISESKEHFKRFDVGGDSGSRVTATFYALARELLAFRESDVRERGELRRRISPKDVGYVVSFLKALYDEDKFSDFIFFTKYELEGE
ncbi:MAG: helix-turn-helix transcriptional regulator [Thermoplasmata archaeon]|nr:helix-turn-helix transcriptional regulator [Thermoplasmata archaeon]